jgi:hypothetical protein
MALSKILPASQEQYAGARNLIINGAMQVAQRGTSATGIGNSDGGYHTLDRWAFRETNTPSFEFTWSQSTDAPDGFGYSMKVDVTTAEVTPVGYGYIQQRFEGQNLQQLKKGTSNAENVTLSFWVKSSKTGTYIVEIRDSDNSRHISKSYSVSSSNTWEHKTITFDGDTSGVLDNDNAESLRLNFWLVADTTYTSGTLATSWASITNANRAVGQTNLMDDTANDWYITGVQLEVGEEATPFEHRSFGDELARCQRYYYRHADGGDLSTASVGTGTMYSASALMCTVSFPVRMRATPTLDHLNATNAYRFWRNSGSDYFNNFDYLFDAHPFGAAIQADSNVSGTAGHGGRIILGGSSAYIAFDAEL